MKKKLFMALFLTISVISGIFAQQIERLTFVDRRTDGTIIGRVTVNAVFISYTQQMVSIENNMQVIRESVFLNGRWNDWELISREPSPMPTIRQLYDIVLGEYNRNPRSAVRLHMQGRQFVRIMRIPDGLSRPMWWSDDGRSFYVAYEFWEISP